MAVKQQGTARLAKIAAALALLAPAATLMPGHGLAASAWTLTGRVVTTSGTPIDHALVGVSVVPAAPLSTPTPTSYIAGAWTAPDGTFAIPAPTLSQDAVAQAAANSGWLNLQLDAAGTQGTTIGTSSGTVDYFGSQGLAVLIAPTSAAAPAIGTTRSLPNNGLVIVDEAVPAAKDVVNDPCSWVRVLPICPAVPAASPTSQCGYVWNTVSTESDFEPVGEYHAWDDQTGWFSYGQTASTTLGVAFQYNGGNWQLSGSLFMGNNQSSYAQSGTLGPYWGHRVNAQFAWAEDYSDNGCHPPAYRIRPMYWTGGFDPNGPDVSGNDGQSGYSRAGSGNQADLAPNSKFDRESGSGYTYGGEVSAFGVTLSAETDYSSSVHMHWDMGPGNYYHSLFGFGTPPTASTLVFSW